MTERGENKAKIGKMPPSRRYQWLVLIAACFFFGYVLVSCSRSPDEVSQGNQNAAPPVNSAENQNALPEIDPNADFSAFNHRNPQHERLPCALCHKLDGGAPVPKLPGHETCSGCHVQQFADNNNQICAICHTNAETGDLKRFPRLKTFNAQFDHAAHLRRANCGDCHQPTGKGVAMSIVSGFNAHSKCFQCHGAQTANGEMKVNFCADCHQPGKPNQTTYNAKAFGFNFTHTNHRRVACTDCHTVKRGAPRGKQVTALVAAMHFPPKGVQSCASCHNNKRAFGGDDFSDCKRCHTGGDFNF